MNQALAFGVLFGGGILLTKAVTGSSFSNIVQGKPGTVSTTGQNLLAGGVAGVGQSIAGAVPATGGSSPLPGVIRWERTDQGVDASATPGTPVQAIVSGVVTAIEPNWYSGQPAVYVSSTGLPGGATGIYYAEQLTPNVRVGQQVTAGQQIGTVAASGTGLEIGFAKGTQTLAQATTGYTEGAVTAAGQLMHNFLQSIGVALP